MPVEAVPELPLDEPPPAPAQAEPAPLSTLSLAILAASAEAPPAAPPEPASAEPAPPEPIPLEPAPPAPPAPALPEPAPLEPAAVTGGDELDPWQAQPELPPEPAAPAEPAPAVAAPALAATAFVHHVSPELPEPGIPTTPVAVHPPVPASELPPVVEPKVPFWKKEISLSGKSKSPKSKKKKKDKKPDFTAVEAALAATAVAGAAAPAAKTPWWKKEIGGKKKQAAVPAQPVPAAAAPTLEQPAFDQAGFEEFETEKKPFWKKELSFSRKPKTPAEFAETAAAAAVAAEAVAAVGKTPWWKKEIGGKKKQAAAPDAAAAPEAPAAPKTPIWKRQISKPSFSRGGGKASGGGGRSHKGAKKLVGLKIGASQIAAARVSNNGVAELEQVARQPLPMGIVVGGELRDPDALSAALKDFFAKNKLPRKGVRLGIANNRIGVRIFDIAGVDDEAKLGNAIRFRAQELPIPLDEAVLDYHVLDETDDPEGRPVKRVLLVVANKELIERYVGACRKAGITLAGIDLEAFALLRSLSPPADRGGTALVAVSIGYDRSTFAVSDGQFCEFTRVLEWGGQSLNVALARAFNSEPSAMEALKCALSLDGSVVPEGVSPESTAAAVDIVRAQVQTFARELVSSLQFYQNQPGSLGIGEIVITGGTAQMPGLAEELGRLIGVNVRVGNPLARLKVSKRVAATPQQVGSLAVAIGLGIED